MDRKIVAHGWNGKSCVGQDTKSSKRQLLHILFIS
jgi:hypothetical protein